jgi:3-methyladenine DNA glycosylase AlkD
MSTALTAHSVINDLKAIATPEKAKASAWFFKTGEGQYGYGDVFIGVTVPQQRHIAKQYKTLPLSEIEKLLTDKIHECRLTALLILDLQFTKANLEDKQRIVDFYLTHTKYINNWDLVDSSAPYILGQYLFENEKNDRSILYRLAKSEDLWEKRIAILATAAFIKNEQYEDTLKIAKTLLPDTHDLIHKAVGWMLREVGKKSKETEVHFLDAHAAVMPRTMLRYAIERFPDDERKKYLNAKASEAL